MTKVDLQYHIKQTFDPYEPNQINAINVEACIPFIRNVTRFKAEVGIGIGTLLGQLYTVWFADVMRLLKKTRKMHVTISSHVMSYMQLRIYAIKFGSV
jgi:hypothetical protein